MAVPPPHMPPGQPTGWGPPPTLPPRRSNTALVAVIIGVCAVLVLAVAGVAAFLLLTGGEDAAGYGGPEGIRHIEGVEYFDVQASHSEDPVDYAQTPPAGGEHHPRWLNCGVYTEPVPAENAVHSQEHGAVWITYQPDLDPAEVEQLTSLYENGSYLIISPYPDLPEPIVLSAWGSQLAADTANDARIAEFLGVYEHAESAPEPGAPCSGGVDP